VLTCEHASNFIPDRYQSLGLPAKELLRHIAWDIGAAGMARRLALKINAPLLLSGYSRLLIDCNRPMHSPTLIPEISESTSIPGNIGLPPGEIAQRAAEFYWPYQNGVSAFLDTRMQTGQKTVLLALHSFTPVFKGVQRPWHSGVLFRKSEQLGQRLVSALDAPQRPSAANEPYQISNDGDYTIPVHGEDRGLDAVLLEIRQDLIASEEGQESWAALLASTIDSVLR